MSSAYTKQKLKQSRDFIQAKDWKQANEACSDVLEQEPDNYNANVFQALALLNLSQFEKSESAYKKAIQLQPKGPLAWQGLEKFYTQRNDRDKLIEALKSQMDIYLEAEDLTKCGEKLQTLIKIQREQGSKSEIASTLSLLLPSSPYYSLLSTLPQPDQTNPTSTTTFEIQKEIHLNSLSNVLEIIGLTEAMEKEKIEKEVEKRRMRLDSGRKSKETLRREIGIEIWEKSKLLELYEMVLSHVSANDEQRRECESKLLKYYHTLLLALPNPKASNKLPSASVNSATSKEQLLEIQEKEKNELEKKSNLRDKVIDLSNGMILLGINDPLAWEIRLDWKDYSNFNKLSGNDLLDLRKYVELNSDRDSKGKGMKVLLKLIKDEGFLLDEAERIKRNDIDVSLDKDGKNQDDLLNLILDSLEENPQSILINRIGSILYLLDNDFNSALQLSMNGLELIKNLQDSTLVEMKKSVKSFQIISVVCWTHLNPPLHHVKALRNLKMILGDDGKNRNVDTGDDDDDLKQDELDCLLSKGYIESKADRWKEAKMTFQRTLDLSSSFEKRSESDQEFRSNWDKKKSISFYRNPVLESEFELAWCSVQIGDLSFGKSQLEGFISKIDDLKESEGEAIGITPEIKARAWWRLGECKKLMGGNSASDPNEAFTCFINSIKRCPTFAPSFTSLGFYYLEVSHPKDELRSSKCFQKAFELDSRENKAAEKLAQGFAEEREWDLVEVIARRTIEGEGAVDVLQSKDSVNKKHQSQNSWAWKAIGNVEFNRKNFDLAIKSFQVAIRSHENDVGSWQRLGESYLESGRHLAALKSFEKALDLAGYHHEGDSQDDRHDGHKGVRIWQILFSVADTKRQIGNLEESIMEFDRILKMNPDEIGIQIPLAETHLQLARRNFRNGYVERAENDYVEALKLAFKSIKLDRNLRSAWKIISDCFFELSRFGRLVKKEFIWQELGKKILDSTKDDGIDSKLPSISVITVKDLELPSESSANASDSNPNSNFNYLFLSLSIYFYKLRVILNASDDLSAGSSWADLSISLNELSQFNTIRSKSQTDSEITKSKICKSQSISSIKQALKSEPYNSGCWLILGNSTFELSPKLSQHSFIRSIECSNNRNWLAWNNLGFLYLNYQDFELANQAFIRAQTLDPDQPQPWVGQALVAENHGDADSARNLFEHAVKLSEGSILEADYGFASSIFSLFKTPFSPSLHHLYSPSFALSAYLSHSPDSIHALHLSGLLSERLGQKELAVSRLEKASDLLEEDYEKNESLEIIDKFAMANVNLGRVRMEIGQDSRSIEAFNNTLSLLDLGDSNQEEKKETGILSKIERARIRLQSHIGIGLAQYFSDNFVEALSAFETALEEIDGNLDLSPEILGEQKAEVSVFLAQVLWAMEGSEQRDAARSQLLDCIATAPNHLGAITSLAAIGIISDDQDLVEAALSEIKDLPPDQLESLDLHGDVAYISSMEKFSRGEISSALSVLSKAAHESPGSIQAHITLLEALIRVSLSIAPHNPGDSSSTVSRAVRCCLATLNLVENQSKTRNGEEFKSQVERLASIVSRLPGAQQTMEETTKSESNAEMESIGQDRQTPTSTSTLTSTLTPVRSSARAVHLCPWEKENWLALELSLGNNTE